MRLLLSILLIVASASLWAQGSVSGQWEGVITQDEGGYRSEYLMDCSFVQQGKEITGRTYIYVDDIYVEMEVKGKIFSGVLLRIEDVRIINSEKKEGMEWCIKQYQLVLKKTSTEISLEGHWQGATSFSDCVPGKVKLRRIIPRA